jgi:uroporphyrinogen III methyltransferase/synthase
VTHRDCATSLTIVTAHEAESSSGIQWPALAMLDGTIVFLMGLANLGAITSKLREHGMPSDRPAAVISHATTPEQQTVTGTLATIEAASANLTAPAIVVVGEVVRFSWLKSTSGV